MSLKNHEPTMTFEEKFKYANNMAPLIHGKMHMRLLSDPFPYIIKIKIINY